MSLNEDWFFFLVRFLGYSILTFKYTFQMFNLVISSMMLFHSIESILIPWMLKKIFFVPTKLCIILFKTWDAAILFLIILFISHLICSSQCTVLENDFKKSTCLNGYFENSGWKGTKKREENSRTGNLHADQGYASRYISSRENLILWR